MQRIWLYGLFILICIIISVTCEVNVHEGVYTSLHESNLVIPRKVNHKGEHVSHNLTHHHDEYEDDLHYHIEINNETLHIELEPSHKFIAPLMVVERHRRDLRSRKKATHYKSKNCHYQGRVRGHDQSRVALSACKGIAGLIKTNNGHYFIEPSRHHRQESDSHPHVIFQRSAVRHRHGKKHRRKRGKRIGKHKKTSNCGTREPNRSGETRLEWMHNGKVYVQGGRKNRGQYAHRLPHRKNSKNRTVMDRVFKMRPRRSVSVPRHVEVLVVADPSMVLFHQDGDIETYLMTIMNIVSSIYKDPTIGNSIEIAVVKIILLEEEEAHVDFNITHAAENTLANFCRWQRNENPKTDDPEHHDVAILITRKDICSTNGCTTLGVANVAGMCRPDRSCSVNEDNGITLAHTITHELGHNFGMFHDTEKTGCDRRSGPIVHVMTPQFEADTVEVSWSRCSRRDITHFLDQGLGECLDDAPAEARYFPPELPPGAMYGADLQCRMQFNTTDESVKMCAEQLEEICSQLWCYVDGLCVTQMRPAAAGTKCGHHQWCQQNECVMIYEAPPVKVDGGWGNWSDWSPCSRSCGGGISYQSRHCDHPAPTNGGSFCIGERSRHKVCNLESCPADEPNFRAQQCTSFNNHTYKGQKYKWLPYFDTSEPCKLYCTDTDDTIIVPWGENAADGTRCMIGRNDMCISGICRKVGCDWVVDSNTTEDQCGICGGTGVSCTTIKAEVNKKVNLTLQEYYEVVTIPAGTRQILVEEMSPFKNYLSVGKTGTNQTYLNGHWLISMPGEYRFAGSLGLYERVDELEKIRIPGPIDHNITIYIVVRIKSKNTGIRYEYTLPTNETLPAVYSWKLGDWTACSATCDGGVQQREPICYQVNSGIVDEENCWSNAENTRPEKMHRKCNEDPCLAHWYISPWQLCPVTCKKLGQPDPIMRRDIFCVDQNELAIPEGRCDNATRPNNTKACSETLPMCEDMSIEDPGVNELDNTIT